MTLHACGTFRLARNFAHLLEVVRSVSTIGFRHYLRVADYCTHVLLNHFVL